MHEQAGGSTPVLICVPHAGRDYRPALLSRRRHERIDLSVLEDRHIDAVGKMVADATGADLLVARAPRALIDLNRAPDDLDPAMFYDKATSDKARGSELPIGHRSARGLGLFPRYVHGQGELWDDRMSRAEGEHRITQVHTPYHAAVSNILAAKRNDFGEALLLDLHSMPSLPAGAAIAGQGIPTHVLGNRFGSSCGSDLADAALDSLARDHVSCTVNRPYAGAYVLDRHGNPRGGIHAIQLEIDRACYLDDRTHLDERRASHHAAIVIRMVNRLEDLLHARRRATAMAAE
ncbi:N-formylglutamate amidohydrolase [Croceicoccus sp. F390]|uniref:N-formylglutamate amidohydrolase n=1 Tax=Croceicoccus esteveae TaxID=3075597 RepID=A0ABU2ZIK0_9SPHN|nr:N-formylglutamate amidohydrolase [Croceicoccus sp. F390]MDT0575237.1 N-formylglutamate amidohydrolase [Croceicoccus sp. F390]